MTTDAHDLTAAAAASIQAIRDAFTGPITDDELIQWENNRGALTPQDEQTLMDDAQHQLRNYHIGTGVHLTPEEKRALEVAECALHAVHDAATLCARAGLIGTAITEELSNASQAMQRVIETIRENN